MSFFSFSSNKNNANNKFDPAKLKANLRMAIMRIKICQNKIINNVKMGRKAIAELIAVNKYDNARVRVEGIMREDLSLEGLEMLSLYCDFVSTRLQIIAANDTVNDDTNPFNENINDDANKASFFSFSSSSKSINIKKSITLNLPKNIKNSCPPPELKEAISSIIWASRHVDSLTEFPAIVRQFELRYGPSFVHSAEENAELAVNERLILRLGTVIPSSEACISYLEAVAIEYGLEFDKFFFTNNSNNRLFGQVSNTKATYITELENNAFNEGKFYSSIQQKQQLSSTVSLNNPVENDNNNKILNVMASNSNNENTDKSDLISSYNNLLDSDTLPSSDYFMTKCGFKIPNIIEPEDDFDDRLIALIRQ